MLMASNESAKSRELVCLPIGDIIALCGYCVCCVFCVVCCVCCVCCVLCVVLCCVIA